MAAPAKGTGVLIADVAQTGPGRKLARLAARG